MYGPLNTTLVNGLMNHDSHAVDESNQISLFTDLEGASVYL